MRFTMPYNGDAELIDSVLSDYSDQVSSVYGSLPRDKFGGGRALPHNRSVDWSALKNQIRRLDKAGIAFNYVINSTNMLNREFLTEYRHEYVKFIHSLQSLGVRMITLSNIFFIELTHEAAPELTISASVNLKTRTPEEVQFLLHLGCADMTLHYDILKDFNALRTIRSLTTVDLKLIPNDVYVMGCPWQKGHTRMQGAHSRDKGFETPYFSYYRNKCVNLRAHRPEEAFKAMWIPPDQLWRYQDIGYDHFKLLDRLATTEWNLRALRCYIEQLSMDEVQQILGTCGDVHSSLVPPIAQEDGPYPMEKLEAIPQINTGSTSQDRLFGYFLKATHPQQCGSCMACDAEAQRTPIYDPAARQQAIENNRRWQRQITKIEFIRSIEKFNRRIRYGETSA
jgi:collagenase-like PrtC family protease